MDIEISIPMAEVYASLPVLEHPALKQLERVANVTAWFDRSGRYLQAERDEKLASSASGDTFSYAQIRELWDLVQPWLVGLGDGAYLR